MVCMLHCDASNSNESGYAMLNLANGVVAAIVNMGLNYYLIPKYGNLGAAMATSVTLIVWSMWRLIEVKWLLNCFPFHKINLLLLGGAYSFIDDKNEYSRF